MMDRDWYNGDEVRRGAHLGRRTTRYANHDHTETCIMDGSYDKQDNGQPFGSQTDHLPRKGWSKSKRIAAGKANGGKSKPYDHDAWRREMDS